MFSLHTANYFDLLKQYLWVCSSLNQQGFTNNHYSRAIIGVSLSPFPGKSTGWRITDVLHISLLRVYLDVGAINRLKPFTICIRRQGSVELRLKINPNLIRAKFSLFVSMLTQPK